MFGLVSESPGVGFARFRISNGLAQKKMKVHIYVGEFGVLLEGSAATDGRRRWRVEEEEEEEEVLNLDFE